jgi:hypothetical protein
MQGRGEINWREERQRAGDQNEAFSSYISYWAHKIYGLWPNLTWMFLFPAFETDLLSLEKVDFNANQQFIEVDFVR